MTADVLRINRSREKKVTHPPHRYRLFAFFVIWGKKKCPPCFSLSSPHHFTGVQWITKYVHIRREVIMHFNF
jgi:hypothetical protein